jgi:hypothetical protein
VKRRQEDILSSNEACRGLREIVSRKAELGMLFSPKTGSLGLRATCPQAGCGVAEKFGLQNRYFEDSIEFKCPNHGPHSLCVSDPSDLQKLELNTPLRNLLRNHIFHSDVNAHWIQIIGADYAGTYQEQFLWRPLMRNPGGNAPVIIYSLQILDWSGAKLSKSLYVQKGAYDYLRGMKLEYMLSYDLFRSSSRSLDSVYCICAD